jgi:cofilin
MVDVTLDLSHDCTVVYNRMKMEKDLRYIIFKIEEEKIVVIDKVGTKETSHSQFISDIVSNEPRFAVYDLEYETNDGIQAQKLILIYWCPDSGKMKQKMIYASAKENLKKRLVGVYREITAGIPQDLSEADIIQTIRR